MLNFSNVKRQIVLLIREMVIYHLLIINLWEVVKWILSSKNGGINLQLLLDFTCKYFIDASINSVLREYSLKDWIGDRNENKNKGQKLKSR
jgi:hypothetical protein